MGIINESEEDNYQEENSKFMQSFSKPYSPSFYLNNKIFDKNQTIKSALEECLQEIATSKSNNNNKKESSKIGKIDEDSDNKIINITSNKENLDIKNLENKINGDKKKSEENKINEDLFPDYNQKDEIQNEMKKIILQINL